MPMSEFMSGAMDGTQIGLMMAGGLIVTFLFFAALIFGIYAFVKNIRGPR